jgi:hypothetical protein
MTGQVPGANARERAVRLAGALAEIGVLTLTFTGPDGTSRLLAARQTDLPGSLLDRGICSLCCTELGIDVEIGPDAITWRAADPDAGARFAAALE